jgi:hypothetical protein
MCTLALFALVIAAVLISRRLAQLVGAAVIILLALAVVALAEERRPPPVPQVGAGCPPGYSASPTSGTCTPSSTTPVPCVPVADGGLPNRVDLLADVAHVRRDGVPVGPQPPSVGTGHGTALKGGRKIK